MNKYKAEMAFKLGECFVEVEVTPEFEKVRDLILNDDDEFNLQKLGTEMINYCKVEIADKGNKVHLKIEEIFDLIFEAEKDS